MGDQLAAFNWDTARCSDQADRERLGRHVSELYGSIASFERYLHDSFLEDCRKHLGAGLFPYKRMLSICFPLLCSGIARLSVADDLSTALFVALSYALIYFVGCPLQILSCKVYFGLPSIRAAAQKRRLLVSMLVSVPLTLQLTLLSFGLRFLSYRFVKGLDNGFSLPDTLTPFLSS